jgi:hypothetical protein
MRDAFKLHSGKDLLGETAAAYLTFGWGMGVRR